MRANLNVNRVLNAIRGRVDKSSLTHSCGGEDCGVDMTDIPSHRVVIDVEREFDSRNMTEKRCDRLLFFINTAENHLIAALIELKSGRAEQSAVVEKLENRLKFAANIAPGPRILKAVYVPVLFHGRDIKWTNPKGLRQLNARLGGKSLQILRGRCGTPKNLSEVLSKLGNL